VDAKHLLDARTFRMSKAPPHADVQLADDPAQFDLGSDILSDPRPFHPARLHALFTQRLPFGLHRSKGWLWLASRPKDVFVWNQSGSHFGLEWAATWKAAILTDSLGLFMREEIDALAAGVAAAHPIFGDRACELTIIGAASDRAVFLAELRACFCTEQEIAAWQRGDTFYDPWPKIIRKI
jgi:G3E family GTPase